MLKLLLCIFCGAGTLIITLQLRQQQLNLEFENNKLHNQIGANQAELWNQQLAIAVCTAPNAVAATIKAQDIKLMPLKPGTLKRSWADDPTAAE